VTPGGAVRETDKRRLAIRTGQEKRNWFATDTCDRFGEGRRPLSHTSEFTSLERAGRILRPIERLAYWLLTGKFVFEAPNATAMLLRHLQTPLTA